MTEDRGEDPPPASRGHYDLHKNQAAFVEAFWRRKVRAVAEADDVPPSGELHECVYCGTLGRWVTRGDRYDIVSAADRPVSKFCGDPALRRLHGPFVPVVIE